MRSATTARLEGKAPSGHEPHGYWVLAAIGVGSFMAALDSSIAHTLLPEMGRSLHASVPMIEWVLTVYLLVMSGTLPAFGRLGDLRGHKDIYVAGFAGFVVASALCGMAPSAFWLILFRGLQGLAASMLYANAPAIITGSFPTSQRGRALGLQIASTYVGYSTGPPLGGILAMQFGWRAIFFVNVPVGLLGVLLAYRLIIRDQPQGKTPKFDLAGAVLFFVGLFALLLALNQGYRWGWTAIPTLALFSGAAAVLGWFIVVERRREHPMLDLSLFRRPVFAGSVFSSLMNYVANSSIFFLLPFYLIGARGLDPARTGLVLMAMPVVIMLVVPITGSLSDRIGSRLPTMIGLGLVVVGICLLAHVTAGPPASGNSSFAAVPLWHVSAALVVCGVGFAAFIAPNNSRLLGAAPASRQGIASGVLAGSRTLGMVLGVAISGAVYTTVLYHAGSERVALGVATALRVVATITAVAIITSWLEREQPISAKPG
jgi:EmrB/QacA subfamily drug resistance transporter